MKSQLYLHLFGSPQFTWQDKPLTGFISNKARALLIYLAVTGRAHSRDALAELLWSDRPSTGRENLKKALNNLRRLDGVCLIEDGWHHVALDLTDCWIDVAEFGRLNDVSAESGEPELLQSAAQLYRADFLDGFNTSLSYPFEEWALREQTRLKVQMVELLRRLADEHVQRQELPQAIAALRNLLHFEPWQEEAHRKLIELLALNDDVGAALSQFEVCRQQLEDELGVAPSAATLELVKRIRDGSLKAGQQTSALQPAQPIRPFEQKQTKTTVEYSLIGREHEWQLIRDRWQQLANGHFVCIGGEAGIGKTRLAEELLLLAEADDASVARARSHELQGQLAYGPITDWLRSAPLQVALSQIEDVWRTELARLLPELLVDGLPPPEPLKEGWQRKRFFDALVHVFRVVDDPLLLVLDDLQWTDAETLEWLQYLTESSDERILVAGTARLNEIDSDHPLHRVRQQLQRHDRYTEVQLSPLTPDATNLLATKVAEQTLADELTQRLFRDTAGNPLFVIESMRFGASEEGADEAPEEAMTPGLSSTVHLGSEGDSLSIPPKMYSVIQARLAQLSPQAQKLSQLGATIGRAFDVALLVKAAESTEENVLLLLDELWQRRIVKEVDHVHFDFSHDRIRDVAYAEIGPIKRRLLHGSVVRALEEFFAENLDSVSGQLAVHCEISGLTAKAAGYAYQVAKQALHLSANDEAIGYLEKAVVLLELLPETKKITKEKISVLTTLAVPVFATRGGASAEVQELYMKAQGLYAQLGEPPDVPLLRGLGSVSVVRADLENAEVFLQELLEHAKRTQEPEHLLEAHYALGTAFFWIGDFSDSRHHFESALDHYSSISPQEHTTKYAQSPEVVCRIIRSINLWCLGYPDQALACGKECLTLAKTTEHALTNGYILSFFSRLQHCLYNPTESLSYAEQAIQFATENDLRFWKAASKPFRGWALSEMGNPEEGLSDIRSGIDDYHSTGAQVSTPWYLGMAARSYYKMQNPKQGLSCIDEAFALAQSTKDRNYEAELWRIRGELILLNEKCECRAEESFDQAISVARRQQAKSWELRATVSLCRLWQKQGKASDAHQLLSEIYGWFTEGFDTVDLVEAKALLDELEHARPANVSTA